METAKDYLIAFTEEKICDEWCKKTIMTFLQKDPENHIGDLAEDLLGIKGYSPKTEQIVVTKSSNDDVIIEELVHVSGVNALAEMQKIRFNPQVNILYGLNGSGKSSYFRIINAITGNKKCSPIRPNVYIDNVKPVSVDLKYKYRGQEKRITWNGTDEGVPEMASIRVFNSDYTKDLLKKRDTDELVVKPYGLHVFADFLSYIEMISSQANDIIENHLKKKPCIDTSVFLGDFSQAFNGEEISDEAIRHLKSVFASTEDIESRVKEKEKQVNDLRVGNPKDKVTIIRGRIKEVEKVYKRLEEIVTKKTELIKAVADGINSYKDLFKRSEARKKEIEILNSIPGSESKSWKEFISRGIKYSEEYAKGDECPFCHQALSEHAKKIIDAYVSYLNNSDQVQFSQVEDLLKEKASEIEKWSVSIDLDVEKIGADLARTIESIIKKTQVIKEDLLSAIERKEFQEIEEDDYSEGLLQIQALKNELENQAKNLEEQSDGMSRSLAIAENELRKIKSDYSIKLQQQSIEEYIHILSWVKEKRLIVNGLVSLRRIITNLSKKAHNDLLTIQLRDKFNKTLEKLGVKNVELDLQGTNNNGVQHTEFTIRKNKDITSILSEGEQKATALALFLSEIELSKNKSAIVFDDPVNSLDHRMIQNLADLLMNIENQVIVFTHNKMFLDSFECSDYGHICKGLNSACNKSKGKHIYLYETMAEGKSRKGVVIEKNLENLEYYLNTLGKILSESPFTKFDDSTVKLRRGVETAIDEIVLNNQVPIKMSNKNSRINWIELKKVCNDESLIDSLHKIHGRVSGGEIHSGTEREENTLGKEEIEDMYNTLLSLRNQYKRN